MHASRLEEVKVIVSFYHCFCVDRVDLGGVQVVLVYPQGQKFEILSQSIKGHRAANQVKSLKSKEGMFLMIWRVWLLWSKITLRNCLKEVRILILADWLVLLERWFRVKIL